MKRRTLLTASMGVAIIPQAATSQSSPELVYATGDGVPHTPSEYSQLLSNLVQKNDPSADTFCRGGAIEQLEQRMAAMLGKEAAVWLPTGTLANHLAIRALAGERRRALVQAKSHLFNDTGDCVQTLSGITLVPLAPGKATFTLDDVEKAAASARSGRVATPIGAIQIETPVRRRSGERFDFDQMSRVCAWAKQHNIGMHLDGARIFIESVYTGRSVREYGALFDTVYVSLYKYFNAGFGAILAGPKALLQDMYHTRRMFGGSLSRAWPSAVLALHYLDRFEEDYQKAKTIGESVLSALSMDANFTVTRIPNGTNVFQFQVYNVNGPVYRDRLEQAGIVAAAPADVFTMTVNPTWTRVPAAEIVRRFQKAMG